MAVALPNTITRQSVILARLRKSLSSLEHSNNFTYRVYVPTALTASLQLFLE
jgi:hypothetical protein